MSSLILLRHGQSRWNQENRFTGWTDIPLTAQGRYEAKNAADICRKATFQIDTAYTSLLVRAVETMEILLADLGQNSISIHQTWRLNERHYGCLQGLNKAETEQRFGAQLVMGWRRSYSHRPPALELDDHRHPRFDPLYAQIPEEILPRTESLADTEARIVPYWQDEILPEIQIREKCPAGCPREYPTGARPFFGKCPDRHCPRFDHPHRYANYLQLSSGGK